MKKNWLDFQRYMRFVAGRFAQDRCSQIAASLTFTTLLSLVPLITIALTLFSAFPVFEDFSAQIKTTLLSNLMPDTGGKNIARYMQQFTESAARLTAVGIGFLAITAMWMMLTIDRAFNVIWRVSRPRPILKRLVIYWAILTLAPLLVGASLSLTSWLVGISMGHAKHIPIFGVGALKVLPVLFTTLAFALMFRLIPNRYVPRSHALIGAVVAAVLFETMNRVFGYYISHFPTYKLVYGAFASVPIFLMWVYLSWLTILLGAVIAASLSHWRTTARRDLPVTLRLFEAIRVLRIMSLNLQNGKVTTFPVLSKKLGIGYDVLEELLEALQRAGVVCKAEGQGWLMMRAPGHIRMNELLRLFVLNRDSLAVYDQTDPVQQWLVARIEHMEQDTEMTLQELFAVQA